jgi:hypothetical protein
MANWAIPQLSDLKIDVLDQLKLRDVDSYTMAESPINPPVGAKRWNTSLNKFEAWNGTAWITMVVSIQGGGTGATDINGFLSNFGLGSMALQNSNAVTITGGTITGLSDLRSAGNVYFAGIISAGSGIIPITNSTGKLIETSIDNIANIAHINANEIISAVWTFAAQPNVNSILVSSNSPAVWFNDSDGVSGSRNTIIFATAESFSIRFYDDAWGTSTPLLSAGRSGINVGGVDTTGQWRFNSQVTVGSGASTTSYILFNGTSASGKGLFMQAAGVHNGALFVADGTMFHDANAHQFRSAANTLYASIDATGKLAGNHLQTLTGNVYGSTGILNAYFGAHSQLYGSSIYFSAVGGASHFMYVTSADCVVMAPQLSVGGIPGTGLRIIKNGAGVLFCGDYYNFYNLAGTVNLCALDSGGTLFPVAGVSAPNGSAITPSFRFSNRADSGAYYNPGNPTVEYGARFNDSAGRSVMRAWSDRPRVDFIVGGTLALIIDAAYVSPEVDAVVNSGHPTARWLSVYAYYGTINQSDIRAKSVDGPIPDALDIVDSIEPIIASLNLDEAGRKFPMFSAQDVMEKLDGRLGTKVVNDENPESLGMYSDRMIPMLWQAVRVLHAEVKALEP